MVLSPCLTLSDILAQPNPKTTPSLIMRLDDKAKSALIKREMEIKRIIRQMELDKLHRSTVFKNLEQELRSIKHSLLIHEASDSKE